MEIKETLITFPKPGSSSESKRVQFSRARSDITNDMTQTDDTRRTKSASRLSSRRSNRLLSQGKITSTTSETGSTPRNQMLLRRAMRSRDSRRSSGRIENDNMFLSPGVEYRRFGSMRSYDSCISSARKERAAKLQFKLKVWTHTLILFQRLHQKIIKENQELEAFKKQMDYTDGNFVALEGSAKVGLDVDHYKAVTKIRMSREAKRILQKDPDDRTEEEIRHVRTDLMVTKTESIQTLPEDCQLRLARNVGLESLGAKRFIIKEGYSAEYCYLIIVGSVIRARLDEGAIRATSDEKPLKEGQMFGESEMRNSSRRKASYISASYTEILRVSAEDYYDIFMAGENIRHDDVLLLKQIDIFRGWNIESMMGKRDKIKRKFFPNNWLVKERENQHEETEENVVALDSRSFEWIYIVKSGSIQVMKQFQKVKPTINTTTGHYAATAHTDGFLEFLTKGADYERQSAYHAPKTSSRPLTASTLRTDTEPPLLNKLKRLLRPHTSGNENRFISTPDSLKDKKVPTSAISSKLVSIPRRRRQSLVDRKDFMSTPTDTPDTQDIISPFEDRNDSRQKDLLDSRMEKESSTLTDYDIQGRLSPTRKKQVTIGLTECWNNLSPDDSTVLCKIKTLTKGDVFGLEYIVFDEMDGKVQPGFVLKSNGSECVMIHKKVYWDLIKDNFDLKEKLRSDVSPYPDEEDLKENLLLRTNWELHKEIVIQDVMSEKARLRPQKHGRKYNPAWK